MRGVVLACVVCACGTDRESVELGTASVTVLASGVPIGGVPVWFQAKDSMLVLETSTDDAGVASAIIEDGAFVTVMTTIVADAVPVAVPRTFAAVRPGDQIVIDAIDEAAPLRRVDISLPAGMERYLVTTGCSYYDELFEPTGTIYVPPCRSGLLVQGTTQNGVLLGWLYAPTIDATVDLSSQAFASPTAADIAFGHFPDHGFAIVTPSLAIDGVLIGTPGAYLPFQGGGATWAAPRPMLLGATYVVEAAVVDRSMPPRWDTLVVWGDGPIAIDGTTLLPAIPRPAVAPNQLTFDRAVTANMVDLSIHVHRESIVRWHVIAPTDGSVVTLPTLPPALAEYSIAGAFKVEIDGRVLDTSVGYDGLRANYLNERGHPLVHGPQGHTVIGQFLPW